MSLSLIVRLASGEAIEVTVPKSGVIGHVKAEVLAKKGQIAGSLWLEGKKLDEGISLAELKLEKESILSFVEEIEDKIKLSSQPEFSDFPFSKGNENFTVMASLKAPLLADVKRAPIDVVMVVDRSGSMRSVMALVVEALIFLIQQLLPSDRLAVVDYDDHVTTLIDLTNMDTKGKEIATARVKGLSARGGTNLAGGLYRGLQLLQARKPENRNEVASVLLFTDGRANEGDTDKNVIVSRMLDSNFIRSFDPENPKGQRLSVTKKSDSPPETVKATINTFGFSPSHNAELLKGIADAASGLYFYIENRDTIGDAFVECMGGLLSVVAQNLVLSVTPVEGIELLDVLTGYAKKKVNASIQVNIKDVQSEESRDVLCQVRLTPLREPVQGQPLLKLSLQYDNVITKQKDTVETIATLDRPAEAKQIINLDVDKNRNRVIAAQALARAGELGNSHRLDEARREVNTAIAAIERSATSREDYSRDLLKSLRICLEGFQDERTYESLGSKNVMSHGAAHMQQRSNMQASGYSNVKKAAMKSSYQQFKS